LVHLVCVTHLNTGGT